MKFALSIQGSSRYIIRLTPTNDIERKLLELFVVDDMGSITARLIRADSSGFQTSSRRVDQMQIIRNLLSDEDKLEYAKLQRIKAEYQSLPWQPESDIDPLTKIEYMRRLVGKLLEYVPETSRAKDVLVARDWVGDG